METVDEERRLLRAAKGGSQAAFSSIYRRYAQRLYLRILLPRLASHADAEDALAETFATLLSSVDDLEVAQRGLWPWLARVASNKATDVHRKRSSSRRTLEGFQRMIDAVCDQKPPAHLDDELALRQAVRCCLDKINQRYARAIELRFFAGKSREEVARVLDVKIGTLDVLVLRALKAFRKEWSLMFDAELADHG